MKISFLVPTVSAQSCVSVLLSKWNRRLSRHMLFLTRPMLLILSGVLICRIHHRSGCSCGMHKYSISTTLIQKDIICMPRGGAPVRGVRFLADTYSFPAQPGPEFKGQPISPSTWLVQIKLASRRSLPVACYQWRLLELSPHRATARQRGKTSMLITIFADLSSFDS